MIPRPYPFRSLLPLPHDALEAILVPLDRLGLVDAVRGADVRLAASALGHTLARAGPVFGISMAASAISSIPMMKNVHAAVEIHAVDTDRWVVLDAKINVLRDAEAEVARLAEVALPQLVLLDLEATLEDLLCLGPADGDVDGDLLVTADTEGSDGESRFAWKKPLSAHHLLQL